MTTLALSIAALALILASWLRAAGSAVNRIPRADALLDASEAKSGASAVAELLDSRDVIGPAVGVVSLALAILSAVLTTAVLVPGSTTAVAVLTALAVAVVVLVLGDLLPRWVVRHGAPGLAYRSSRLLTIAVALGGWADDLLPEPEQAEEESDLITNGEVESSNGQERELIDSVIEFSGTTVKEVMTPRPDMVTVAGDASIEELVTLATFEGFSRFPVISNGDVVGMVVVKDLLPMLTVGPRAVPVKEVMRPVGFVPETKLASALLAEMQESHVHQEVVVDEYGDVVGLVTIEDLLEELVGEIADETDLDEELVQARGDGWDVDARLPVDDLVELTGVQLPNEEWDTVGGLVLGLAERVPREGEEFSFDRLMFRVTKMQGRRVSNVSVTLGTQ